MAANMPMALAAAPLTAVAPAPIEADAAMRSPPHEETWAGGFASMPDEREPASLLVALHGDHQRPADLYRAWARWTAPQGIGLFVPACPAPLGCRGSWWRWNGSPRWLVDQVDALAARHPLDGRRLWVLGWSGGASYMGLHTQELEGMFAAIVLHGGGLAPAEAQCADPTSSVFFLVGDKNPNYRLAVGLREHYEACGNEVAWNLLPGADHAAEWRALDANAGALLDWLGTKRRGGNIARATAPTAGVIDASRAAAEASVDPPPLETKPFPHPRHAPSTGPNAWTALLACFSGICAILLTAIGVEVRAVECRRGPKPQEAWVPASPKEKTSAPPRTPV